MSVLVSYLIVAFITSFLLIFYMIRSFKKGGKTGIFLGSTFASSVGIFVSYILAVLFSNNSFVATIFASLSFIGMDFLVLNLFSFAVAYTEANMTLKHNKGVLTFLHTLLSIDVLILLLTPFINLSDSSFIVEIVKGKEVIDGIYSIKYEMHALYYYHLGVDYLIVGIIAGLLITKAITVPLDFKLKYLNVVFGIFALVLINAIYLFLPEGEWNILDYSLLLYGVVSMFVFWCVYKYAKKDLLNKFKSSLFDSLDQGIILFDFNDDLLLWNEVACKFLPSIDFTKKTKLQQFLIESGFEEKTRRDDDIYSFQCLVKINEKTHPLRCDYRKVFNSHKQLVGKLFVLVDMSAEIDLLTGFQSWENFKRFALNNNDAFSYPLGIGICDIIGLGIYNEIHGREDGDNLLRELSSLIQSEFNGDCHFVRGREAALIVFTYGLSIDEINGKFENIKEKFSEQFTYSSSIVNNSQENMIDVVLNAFNGINAKRLLDKRSTHSNVISSLIKALQQCDTDTEAHVIRTQVVGTALGKRIGLSELEISQLSLLCLLHDIGKIGVPLEILNKPGKLTPEEWDTIKSHVIKGFNIAMSSEELKGIASMIKHHHERWDGKGYPDGLSRESIPILSRIIAVVDAFDAMVNDRCYRKALPVDVAKEEILKNAGTQFDPFIASEFLRLIEEGTFYNLKNKVEENIEDNAVDISEKSNNQVSTSEAYVYPVIYSKYYLDSDNFIEAIDDAFTQITGYTMDDINERGMKQSDLIPPEERAAYSSMAIEQIGQKQMAYFEHRIVCKDGKTKYVLCIGLQKFDSASRDMRTEIIICDALQTNTARALNRFLDAKNNKRLEEWESIYRKDSLTGLLTHKSFQNDIEERLLKGTKVTLGMIDVDYFKNYNDTYGHHAGDEFLIAFAQGILASCGDDCICSRMGGDEFAIAIIGDHDIAECANKLSTNLDFLCHSNKHPVTCSIGFCESDEKINTFNLLYELADKALYDSKKLGRNRYTIYKK